MILLNKN